MSRFHVITIADTNLDAGMATFDWWKARVLHYINTAEIYDSGRGRQLNKNDKELFQKLYYTAPPLWPTKESSVDYFPPWNHENYTQSTWFKKINNFWRPPTTLGETSLLHPKLALICKQYTFPDARYLYWLETGIDVVFSGPVTYGPTEMVYQRMADAIVRHNLSLVEQRKPEADPKQTIEMNTDHCKKCLCFGTPENFHCTDCFYKSNNTRTIPPTFFTVDLEQITTITLEDVWDI